MWLNGLASPCAARPDSVDSRLGHDSSLDTRERTMGRDQSFEQQVGSASGGGLLERRAELSTVARSKLYVNGTTAEMQLEEIDRILREGYSRGGAARTQAINTVVRLYPDLTRPMLWKRAQQLELACSPSTFRKWNPAETRLLMDFINELPIKAIAERLGRPLKSVLGKVRSLQMSSRVTTGLSIRQAASDLQVSHHTVEALIRGGALVVEDNRITDKSYRKYCQSLHHVVRQEAVPEEALAQLDRVRVASDFEHARTMAIVHLLASGGLSLREVAGLGFNDVRWIDPSCARVQVRQGKTDPERVVILTGTAAKAVREFWSVRPKSQVTDRLIVDARGKPVPPHSLEAALIAFGHAESSAVRFTSRGLRHAYAFRFLRRECRPGSNDAFIVLPKLSRLMGHYSPDTVQMYVGVLHPKTGGRRKQASNSREEGDDVY